MLGDCRGLGDGDLCGLELGEGLVDSQGGLAVCDLGVDTSGDSGGGEDDAELHVDWRVESELTLGDLLALVGRG